MNIAIAGAGLLGHLLAWRLSSQGHRITVFDPAANAQDRTHAAGWAAAGMLSPWAELENADLVTLGLRSIALWETTVKQLVQTVHFECLGSLLLAHRHDLGAAQRVVGLLAAQMPGGEGPQPINLDTLQALEPAVHGPTHAWQLHGEGHIHTVQALQALAATATQHGVQWRWSHTVAQLEPGQVDGEPFDHVFDVRGVGARPALPVRGVRGEIVWLHAPGVALHRPLRLLHPRSRVYLVPRPDDDAVVVGASEIESEDRSPISVRTLLNLLSAAHSVLPELAEARVIHTQTQLRPALPDNLPHISTIQGLTRINGLFRHGWLIAPALIENALEELAL
jgi:glycine oxidase